MISWLRQLWLKYKHQGHEHKHSWSPWFGPFYVNGKVICWKHRYCYTCHDSEEERQ